MIFFAHLDIISHYGLDDLPVLQTGRVPSERSNVIQDKGAQAGDVLLKVNDVVRVELVETTKGKTSAF